MARTSPHHHELTNHKGKCSVPMWSGGAPAGFCDQDAFGEQTKEYFSRFPPGDRYRRPAYAPGLACAEHGGPKCPGLEIEPGVFSGCDQSGGDCPTCGK